MRRQGYTLLEVIIAVFLLGMAALVAGQMFRLSLRTAEVVRDEGIATLLCERRLREIGDWAAESSGTGYNFTAAWIESAPPFAEAVDPDDARFTLVARSSPYVLHSPANGLRGDVPMGQSVRAVKVTARWGSEAGALRSRTLSLVGLVSEPPRQVEDIRVQPATATLSAGGTVDLKAEGVDERGVIPDLVFRWHALPGSGNVTLSEAAPDGATAFNYVKYPNGQRWTTGGSCPITVRARSDGRDLVARPIVLDLGSPAGPLP